MTRVAVDGPELRTAQKQRPPLGLRLSVARGVGKGNVRGGAEQR